MLGTILGAGGIMSGIALTGALTLAMPPRWLVVLLPRLSALAAGTLLGGALFHMLPEALDTGLAPLPTMVAVAVGFVSFLGLERALTRWRPRGPAPKGWLLLLADGLHNFLGGLAVGGAFLVAPGTGWVAWWVAVAHEVPQELGDFGVLVAGGLTPRRALVYNLASALTFPLGGVVAWATREGVEPGVLLALGAGNFLYLAAVDLLPELARGRPGRAPGPGVGVFLGGLVFLLGVRWASLTGSP